MECAVYYSLRYVQCNCPSCVMVGTLCTKADARVLDAAFVCYQSIAVFCKRLEEYKERQGPLKRLKPRNFDPADVCLAFGSWKK